MSTATRGSAAKAPARRAAPAAKQRPKLEVVRQPRPAPTRRALGLLGSVAAALVFAGLLGLAVLHALLVQGQLRIDRLTGELADEQARAVDLRLQVADLEAPTRILAEANRLGMVVPIERGWLVPVEPGDPEAPLPPPGLDPFGAAPVQETPAPVEDVPADDVPADGTAETAEAGSTPEGGG